jgi:predicted AlkP superfamily pyrophosphatase or phosphodiesterase
MNSPSLILPREETAAGAHRKWLKLTVVVLALAALASLGAWLFGQDSTRPAAAGRHVLVISLDGMGADFYAQMASRGRLPNLARLHAEGSFAEAVEGVYPSVTYPSHTTIATGRLPAEHGIYSNVSVRDPREKPDQWFWYTKDIKAPTLWDEARRAHLTSAAVSWPVTVGAAIDWNVPEIWDPGKGEEMDLQVLAQHSTPGLVQEAAQALGPMLAGAGSDTIRTRFAAHLLKKYRPNLTLIHLANPDHEEHEHGPESPEAAKALEAGDAHVGELLQALQEAGMADSTVVFVVSDHGFLPIDHDIRPNVLLAKAGLLSADSTGQITGGRIFTLSNGGSFFIYWPDTMDLRSEVQTALKPLLDQGVLWAEFDRAALHDLGAEPAVKLALDAPKGYAFTGRAAGDVVGLRKTPGGTHGYLPYRAGLEASFIVWGPGIRRGLNLHRIRMTSEGPTILKALRVSDPKFGDQPPLGEIFK